MRGVWFVILAILLAGCQTAPDDDPGPTTTAGPTTDPGNGTSDPSGTVSPCVPQYQEAHWEDAGLLLRLENASAEGWNISSTRPEGALGLPTDEANATLGHALPHQIFFGPFGGAGVLPRLGVFLEPGPRMVAVFPDHPGEDTSQAIARVAPHLRSFLENVTDLDGDERGDLVFATTNNRQPGPSVDGQATLRYSADLNESRLRLQAWYEEQTAATAWEVQRGATWQFASRAGQGAGFQADPDSQTPLVWGARYIMLAVEASSEDGALMLVVPGDPDKAVYVAAQPQPSAVSLREALRQDYRALGLGLLPRDVSSSPSGCDVTS